MRPLSLPCRPVSVAFRAAALVLAASAACAPAAAPLTPKPTAVVSGSLPLAPLATGEEGAVVPIAGADPVWGSRQAPVTLVVFGDFQCPYTGKIRNTVHALEAKYGPADLRVVWKDVPLPFHPQARPTAEAGQAVFMLGQSDAFWKFWDAALENQTTLSASSSEDWAKSSGVEVAAYRHLVETHGGAPKVDADRAVADRLGVVGTPTFLINGVSVEGAQPLAKLVAVIDAEAGKAKARLASGTSPDALYAAATKDNWKPPVDDDDGEPKEDPSKVWRVPVAGAPMRGGAQPLVTIVEFSDFQCPYCKKVEPTLRAVADKYGDKVRLVWRDEPLPFHPHAKPAATLAREARAEKGDAGFWAAHDAIFEATSLNDDDLIALGTKLGLHAERVKTALEQKRFAAELQTDLDLAEDVEAAGTPHFFINGRRLVGAQPLDRFTSLIDEELAHAGRLLAAGTPKAKIYDAVMAAAAPSPIGEQRTVHARSGAPFRGAENAPIVIEEFADFQCPFCTRAEETLRTVTRTYGTKVKVVWRNLPLPFHSHAQLAAEAAAEAQHQKGNTGFWAMHDLLFAHQGDHDGDGSGLERVALDGYAKEIGLDVPAFDRALDEHRHAAEIAEDAADADAARIAGTPAFVVAGTFIPGAQPFSKFRRAIDRALAATPAVAKATP